MQVINLTSALLASNCYIIISKDQAMVIDPSVEPEKILSKTNEYSSIITKIIYTHAHVDHIYYGDELKRIVDADIYGHKNDLSLYSDEYKNGSILFGLHRKFDPYDIEVHDQMKINLGNEELTVIHTPGHTMGCVCIHINDLLFTGDTLFYESVGRTDLGTGDSDMLYDSIKNKIFTLPDSTIILPGHGIKSTLAHEKENNRYVY